MNHPYSVGDLLVINDLFAGPASIQRIISIQETKNFPDDPFLFTEQFSSISGWEYNEDFEGMTAHQAEEYGYKHFKPKTSVQ